MPFIFGICGQFSEIHGIHNETRPHTLCHRLNLFALFQAAFLLFHGRTSLFCCSVLLFRYRWPHCATRFVFTCIVKLVRNGVIQLRPLWHCVFVADFIFKAWSCFCLWIIKYVDLRCRLILLLQYWRYLYRDSLEKEITFLAQYTLNR